MTYAEIGFSGHFSRKCHFWSLNALKIQAAVSPIVVPAYKIVE
jgi:hypothetical protein